MLPRKCTRTLYGKPSSSMSQTRIRQYRKQDSEQPTQALGPGRIEVMDEDIV